MKNYIERTFPVQFLQWGEPDDDGESYAVVWHGDAQHGEIIRASSPALLIGELLSRRVDWQVAA